MIMQEILVGALSLGLFVALVFVVYTLEKRRIKKARDAKLKELIDEWYQEREDRKTRYFTEIEAQLALDEHRASISARVNDALINNSPIVVALQGEPLPSKSTVKSYHQLKKRRKHKK